jgi:hypothetical protein
MELLGNPVWAGFGDNIEHRPDDIAADIWVRSQAEPESDCTHLKMRSKTLERAKQELAQLRGLRQGGEALVNIHLLCRGSS